MQLAGKSAVNYYMNKNVQLIKVQETIEQELAFKSPGGANDLWRSALSLRINELIQNDFQKLISILYRLDINEDRLMQLLKNYPGSDAGIIIGELIIERQLQKINSREAFRQDNPDINENEKW
jgi:hypothetical protein